MDIIVTAKHGAPSRRAALMSSRSRAGFTACYVFNYATVSNENWFGHTIWYRAPHRHRIVYYRHITLAYQDLAMAAAAEIIKESFEVQLVSSARFSSLSPPSSASSSSSSFSVFLLAAMHASALSSAQLLSLSTDSPRQKSFFNDLPVALSRSKSWRRLNEVRAPMPSPYFQKLSC